MSSSNVEIPRDLSKNRNFLHGLPLQLGKLSKEEEKNYKKVLDQLEEKAKKENLEKWVKNVKKHFSE